MTMPVKADEEGERGRGVIQIRPVHDVDDLAIERVGGRLGRVVERDPGKPV
jgi:hypothetical protein